MKIQHQYVIFFSLIDIIQIFTNRKWTNPIYHRSFFDNLQKQMNFKSLDDFYHISQNDIKTHGGQILLDKVYDGSFYHALQSVYPDHKWLAWKFSQKVPQGYWNDINNKREFMNWLGKQLGYQKMDDWYNLHWKDIAKYGGWSLLMKYNGSPSQILQSVYPEHKWIIWMFNSVSTGFWDIKENQKEFMNWLQKQLGYSKLDDWYNLTQKDIVNNGGVSLLTRYNSPAELICSIYNEHNWTMWNFKFIKKTLAQ